MPVRAPQAARPLTEAVRAIYLERRTGVLEVSSDDASDLTKRRLFFIEGELHLPAHHSLAKRLGQLLPMAAGRALRSMAPAVQTELRDLLRRIGRLVAGWEGSPYLFYEGRHGLAPGLVGPLPTASLLMDWAVTDRTHQELLTELGGARGELTASAGAVVPPAVAPVLEPQEAQLLARLTEPAAVADLLRQSPDGAEEVVRWLARLVAIGLVRRRREPAGFHRGARVPADVLDRLSDRIERELALSPLRLREDEQRTLLVDLLARAGGLNHYELLGIGSDARADDVYEAYVRIARQVHPSHADRLELGGREAALWLLFERATDAYLTLSNPDRRARYDHAAGIGHDPLPTQEVRVRESEAMARGYAQRGAELLAGDEVHFAVELLRQAVVADPKPEYYQLLGEAQSRNPHWARQSADAFQKAIELGGETAVLRNALGRCFEALALRSKARGQFERALALKPDDPEALAGIARVAAAGGDEEPKETAAAPRAGWLQRLLGLFR